MTEQQATEMLGLLVQLIEIGELLVKWQTVNAVGLALIWAAIVWRLVLYARKCRTLL
ncbi:MAG: hypothetical protein ACF8CY_06760 [Gimesia chilikensis]